MSDWPRLADRLWVEETNKRVQVQERHRATLARAESSDENALHSLDSTLKKTTAFMKKLKSLSAASVPSLIEELSRLNLSKFVEEMAAGIAETKLKPLDVIPIVDLCVAIASRYSKFPELLLAEIKKGLPLKRTDKILNPAKLRIDVRLVCYVRCVVQLDGKLLGSFLRLRAPIPFLLNKEMQRARTKQSLRLQNPSSKGDATSEDKAELETAKSEFERLKSLATELSNSLGVSMVELKEEPSDNEEDEAAALEKK
ncbi:hypothetical protein ANCCEY_12715 [Ancylostoma ceylanicum]|uniref:MIF4G domain-containing protein n=1 Tax=Ancylostoma ceylanicum TaxID=53326 RepID=A0A0D6LE39_9BILA|nr:hypothetical protein ANCCEY_12715 [Ancylostoma ceylanicum]